MERGPESDKLVENDSVLGRINGARSYFVCLLDHARDSSYSGVRKENEKLFHVARKMIMEKISAPGNGSAGYRVSIVSFPTAHLSGELFEQKGIKCERVLQGSSRWSVSWERCCTCWKIQSQLFACYRLINFILPSAASVRGIYWKDRGSEEWRKFSR